MYLFLSLFGVVIMGTAGTVAFLKIRKNIIERKAMSSYYANIVGQCEEIKNQIMTQIENIDKNYEHNVSYTILLKVNWMFDKIVNRVGKIEEKLYLLKNLRDLIYETETRLASDYMNVRYVMNPLNEFLLKLCHNDEEQKFRIQR